MSDRGVNGVLTRSVVAIAALVLAIAVAPRIPLDFAGNVSFPEIRVWLHLPASNAADPNDVTTRWIVPIESACRSLGDVVATRGRIEPDGGTLAVRFKAGTDPAVKTARLLSELAPLRARLPADAQLGVWPALQSGARPTIVVALTGDRASALAAGVAEELRSAAGVRDVRIWGDRPFEVSVRLHRSIPPDITPDLVRRAILDQMSAHAIGAARIGVSGNVRPLVAARSAGRIEDVAIRSGESAFRLSTLADVRSGLAKPQSLSRMNGRPAVLLAIDRDRAAPLFRFDRGVRSAFSGAEAAGVTVHELWNEAAEVRSLLRSYGIGALLAMLVLGAFGFVRAGVRGIAVVAFVPLALAVFVLFAAAFSMRVDAQAMIAASIAVAAAAPLAAAAGEGRLSRVLIFVGFAALLPIAVTFGSGSLAPFLRGPARAFLAAAVGAAIAVMLLPAVAKNFRGGSPRRLLRKSAPALLAVAASVYLLLTWFGSTLDPRASGRSPERTNLYAQISLPRGSTLMQTSAAVDRVEAALRNNPAVRRFWSTIGEGTATTSIVLQPSAASGDHALLIAMLRASIRLPPGVVSIDEQFDRSAAMRMSEDVEERPETDEEATFYRVVLKSTNIESLQQAFESLNTRLRQHGVRQDAIMAAWGSPARRIDLTPRETAASTIAIEDLATRLAERSLPPRAVELPQGWRSGGSPEGKRTSPAAVAEAPLVHTVLRVAAADAPDSADQIPQSDALFNTPLATRTGTVTAMSVVNPRDAFILGSVERELGRFVLPVNIRVPGMTMEVLPKKREEIDSSLAAMPLPPDSSLARPSLSSWQFSIEKLRLIGMATFVPLLLFTAAVIVLNSAVRAVYVLVPSAAAIALVSPLLLMTHGEVDESVLLAIAAAACGVAAQSAMALMRSQTTAGTYRTVRDSSGPVLAGAVAAACIVLVPALSDAALQDGWRPPLLAACVMLVIGGAGSHLVSAALVFLENDARRRLSPENRALRRPLAWSDASALPRLRIRNVTKVYAGGFRALHRVSFDLEPGIIGLLGPNGAGKTTLLRILAGLLLPTRGEVLLHGTKVGPENLAAYRRLIGFLPQEFNAYAAFTAEQFLDFWAIERGMTSAAERATLIGDLLAAVDLVDAANRRVRDFSGGMRQRIGIARALIGDPPLLIVDEPTTGLDIEARSRFRGLMRAIARRRIVILSTHIASDVEAAASRLLLLDHGTLRYDGTSESLIERARGRVFEAVVSDHDARALSRTYRVTTRVRVVSGIRIRAVVAPGEPLAGASVEPTLEEAYLAAIDLDTTRRLRTFAFLSERRPSAAAR